jgi:hypothetical protein
VTLESVHVRAIMIVSNYERRARQATSESRLLHSTSGIKSTITAPAEPPAERWEIRDYGRVALSPDGHLGTGSPGVPPSAYESQAGPARAHD